VSALRYDLTQVTQRQTVNCGRVIRLVGDSVNIRDNSLARDSNPCGRKPFMAPAADGATTQIKQWREAVRTRNTAAPQILAAEFYFAGGGSAIDAMEQIPAREMPVQARDPSLEPGVLIKRPFGVRVTNGCEIV
jgi:hypothetical protein